MPPGAALSGMIEVQIASRVAGIPATALLRKWVRAALRVPPSASSARSAPSAPAGRRRTAADGSGALLTLRIVNRAEAQRLHRDFRGKDYATNVLTFAYSTAPLEADIVLCAQVLAREAREQGKSLAAHYAHLTMHGVLHAQGFDHEKPRDAERMEAREIAILGTLGFANPYQESVPNLNHG